MISAIGIKQASYPALDPARQEQGNRGPESIRPKSIRPMESPSKGVQVGEEDGKRDSKLSNEVLQAFKQDFSLINNVELKFNRDKETGQTYIKIVDKDTGKTLREIPPEEVRKLAEKLDEMVGILFDKKA